MWNPRGTFRLLAPMMVATLLAGSGFATLGMGRVARADSSGIDLSVLAGPGWNYDTLAVAPAGAEFSIDGAPVDGFSPVTYNGVSGWVQSDAVGAPPQEQAQQTDQAAPADAAPADGTWTDDGSGAAPADQAAAPVDQSTDQAAAPADGTWIDDGSGAAPAQDGTWVDDGSGNAAPADQSTAGSEPETVISAEPVSSDNPQGKGGKNANANNGTDANGEPALPAGQSPAAGAKSDYTQRDILDIIRQAATNHGQNPDDMIRVAKCESGLNPYAVDSAGQYYGLFQFVPSTFSGTPYGDQDIFDPRANAEAAGWMWEQGRKSEWSCQ